MENVWGISHSVVLAILSKLEQQLQKQNKTKNHTKPNQWKQNNRKKNINSKKVVQEKQFYDYW